MFEQQQLLNEQTGIEYTEFSMFSYFFAVKQSLAKQWEAEVV
jgi:hypothetical protein